MADVIIYLRAGDATPSTIILRDPTVPDSSSVTGALAWTESDDIAALAATLTVTIAAAWTEADDTVAIGSTVTVTGVLAWTEADDVFAAGSTVRVDAALAWTEADDVVAIASTVGVEAALAWTEADDQFAAQAFVRSLVDTHDGPWWRYTKKKPANRAEKRRLRRDIEEAIEYAASTPVTAERAQEWKRDFPNLDRLASDLALVERVFVLYLVAVNEQERLIEEENAAAEVLVRAYL